MRDWKSGIVTITVRDQRYRQHDPILGVVPLRLTDILQTSSQVTRWYPLDGGIVCSYLAVVGTFWLILLGFRTHQSFTAIS